MKIPQIEIAPTRTDDREIFGKDGVRHLYEFSNGYAASVVHCPGSYGYDRGLWELAVIRGDRMVKTPVTETDDVVGYLTDDDVAALFVRIAALPAPQPEEKP